MIGTFSILDDPAAEWPGAMDLQLLVGSTVLMTVFALVLNLWCAMPPTVKGGVAARDAEAEPGSARRAALPLGDRTRRSHEAAAWPRQRATSVGLPQVS